MKLSFNTFPYSSFPSWLPSYPIDYVIGQLARIGYDGIELGCASPVAYPPYLTKNDREKIAEQLRGNRIEISSVLPAPGGGIGNNVASPIEAERKQAVQSYKDCIDLAGDLNAGICIYVAGWIVWGVDPEQAWEWSKECLVEIAAYAKPKNVLMAIEPTAADSNLVETADDALNMMKEVNMANVKVMFDTIHVLYRKEVPTDYVERMGPDLVHVHLSDTDRMPPGTHNDFSLLVDALKANGYHGYLAMEIGLRSRGLDVNEIAKKAHDYMRRLL